MYDCKKHVICISAEKKATLNTDENTFFFYISTPFGIILSSLLELPFFRVFIISSSNSNRGIYRRFAHFFFFWYNYYYYYKNYHYNIAIFCDFLFLLLIIMCMFVHTLQVRFPLFLPL